MKIFILFFLFISIHLSSQQNALGSLQQKDHFVKGTVHSNTTDELANKYRDVKEDYISYRILTAKAESLDFKHEIEKREAKILMQQKIIKQKDKFIIVSSISIFLFFVASLFIFMLYRNRNKSYKLLVYNSDEKNKTTGITDENSINESKIEHKNGNLHFDEELKTQIENSLKVQIDAKVFLEPQLILKTLAEKCDTNRSYLSQFINEKYNSNFNSFINMLRINEAQNILSDNNNIPLKELYIKLGFHSYSVFNEAFKKQTGVTPNYYQKSLKDFHTTFKPNENQQFSKRI